MYLELKESNSPFWLIGAGKNGTFAGSSTNIPCYYKSRRKQEEIANQIFKNDHNVEEVYLLTGTQWDNMPSGSKEEYGYIKNKGRLILSKNQIMEGEYPKGVSRDPLPKKGVKVYTSPATALENNKGEDKKMKLELKEKTEEKYIFNPGNSKEAWDSEWTKVKELAGKECVIVNSEYVSNMPKDFENMQHSIKFDDGTTLDGVFGEYLSPILEENKEPITEAIPWKAIATGAMHAVDNWDTLKDMIETIKETSTDVYNKVITIFNYLKGKNANPKDAAKDIANMVAVEESLTEGATKLEKGEGSTFENAGTTWKVIKQNDEDTLVVALDKDGNEKDRYVVAWGLQKDNSWNQGHYFTDKDIALKYFNKREKKQESLKESKIAIKNISSDKIQSEKELKQSWINELKHDLSNDTLEDRKKQYPFKQWCDNLVSTGDFEYVKESKIVTPVGNPQTAGSFVNIDVDLDHMEVSDFIVRLAQAIRSEQTAVLEYVALMSSNGITNEDRTVIEGIMKEEKNHMCALTALLYKQILMNHKENVDEANDEFTLPKLGADIFDEDNKLTESVSNTLEKIIAKEALSVRMSDDYLIGDGEDGRMYHGLQQALDAIKNIISKSGEEVVIQNITLSNKNDLKEETFNNTQELINELKTDTNYDEIAYHIHEYSKTDKKKALELMDLLFELEDSKSPKECVDEIINHLTITEDTKITPKDNKYNVEIDVEYDSEVANQVFDNIAREVGEYNKNNEINLSDLGLKDGKFYFTVNKEVDEQTVKNICNEIFDKATNYEYQIVIA